MTELAPIVLFVYNRPWHTGQTLEALSKNDLADESVLYVFADGHKKEASEKEKNKIAEVRNIVKKKKWCKEVHLIERERNFGLADNIIDGVTKIVNEYGKIIVLEDDIITSKGFLKFMNDALTFYESEDKVMHVSGYMFPVKEKLPETFFYNAASCWGWGTWKSAWKKYNSDTDYLIKMIDNSDRMHEFNLENSNDFYSQLKVNIEGVKKTWGIKWHTSVFLNKGLCLHTYPSLVNNIGFDETGDNCGISDKYRWSLLAQKIVVNPIKLVESVSARKAMVKFYNDFSNKHTLANDINVKRKFSSLIPEVFKRKIRHKRMTDKHYMLYRKYKELTMIPENIYLGNLSLYEKYKNVQGCIVECGVWRGGMIASIADILGKNRNYFLFDSFEGLPDAKEIDGQAANAWQNDKNSPVYFDNCRAEMNFAEKAMKMSGAKNYKLIKGWFSESLPDFNFGEKIAILRLDGDWYDSTMDCLKYLFYKVNQGGIIIIDDYYTWDGCSRSVHDFFSKNNLTEKVRQTESGICYIIKV